MAYKANNQFADFEEEEEEEETPVSTQPTTPPTSDKGSKQDETPANSTFNINELPKEAWDAIYQSGRFKELNQKAKQADQLLKERQAAEQAALEEQGKWKEIAEKRESEVKSWTDRTMLSEIKAFAAKYGAHDINDVAALADRSTVNINDDGQVMGAEDAVKALFESKPHLFNNQTPTTKVGSGTNPGDAANSGNPKFTLSQIRDPEFFREHETDIMAAMKNGQVVNDTM